MKKKKKWKVNLKRKILEDKTRGGEGGRKTIKKKQKISKRNQVKDVERQKKCW